MKYRLALVATGAGIGLAYLLGGVFLLRWIGYVPLAVNVDSLTTVGMIANIILSAVGTPDDSDRPGLRLLLVQGYLPPGIVLAGIICNLAFRLSSSSRG